MTSACFLLSTRRPCEVAVSIALRREEELPALIDAVGQLKRLKLITSVIHIGNRARTHSTLAAGVAGYLEKRCGLDAMSARSEAERALKRGAPHAWTGLGAVCGSPAQVRAAVAEIRSCLGRVADVRVVTQKRLDMAFSITDRLRHFKPFQVAAALVTAVRPLHGLTLGVPTDAAIEALLWQFGCQHLGAEQLDDSHCGILYVSPALPMEGAFVCEVLAKMRQIAARHGHELHITLNVETQTSLVGVANLLFDKRVPAEVSIALRCASALLDFIRGEDLEVYRTRADMMAGTVARDPAYWQTVTRLKRAYDPDNIIAPGRYSIDETTRDGPLPSAMETPDAAVSS